jgi:hypothetical protein
MSARDQITTLMNRYGFTIDTGDLDGFAELFGKGEWTSEGSPPNFGKQAMLDNVLSNVRIYPDGTPRTKHVTANVELVVDEAAGKAKSECYVTVFQQTDDFPLQAIFSGHYFDDFVCENGTWRFARRFIRYALVGDMRAHLTTPAAVIAAA